MNKEGRSEASPQFSPSLLSVKFEVTSNGCLSLQGKSSAMRRSKSGHAGV